MKHIKGIKLLLVILSLFVGFTGFCKKNVAVYITGDQPDNIKTIIGSKMVYYITQSDEYTAIERTSDFLEALSAERDYAVSGEVSNSQIVKLGQQFGARYVAVINTTDAFGEIFITSRLINVETNSIDASYDAYGSASSISDLTNIATDLADGLLFEPQRKLKEKEEEKKRELERQKKEAELKKKKLKEQAQQNLLRPGETLYGNYAIKQITLTFDFNEVVGVIRYLYYDLGDYQTADEEKLVEFYSLGVRGTMIRINSSHIFPSDWPGGVPYESSRLIYYNLTSTGVEKHEYVFPVNYNKKRGCYEERGYYRPTCYFIAYRTIPDEDIDNEIKRLQSL